MRPLTRLSAAEMRALRGKLLGEYGEERKKDFHLDMSRGRPDAAQLDLSTGLLDQDPRDLIFSRNGTDVRNYGGLAGLDEARELFADLLGLRPENIIVGGQSSLALMYDVMAGALLLGVLGGAEPWGRQGRLRFLCPVPGYDRHFRICEQFGIEMISVPLRETGPDMDLVRRHVESDPSVKGIWCVPKYANPTGYTFSPETVEAFASLKPAADDFRIFWDNAYLIHDHGGVPDRLENIFDACRKHGSEDLVYEFFSMSKVTFPGGGIVALGASEANTEFLLRQMAVRTIGYDKINQLRHVRFFRNADGVRAHMKRHAALLRPKFDAVLSGLEDGLGGSGIGRWTRPNGGYFISYDGLPGTAKRCVRLCAEAGLRLTAAGASYPYGKDPEDRNIRIAPTCATVAQLRQCVPLFCLCQKLAALEVLMKEE